MVDLNDMLYFVEVVERGGFAAAGRALGIPKSRLSRRVAELEAENAALRREMEIARIRLAEADAVRQENVRLKGLLGLRDSEARPVAVARLVGSTASSTRRFLLLFGA